MAGRNRDSGLTKIEKSIRTLAWYNEVLLKSNCANANQLAQHFEFGERNWGRYSRGEVAPAGAILKRVEQSYPGSMDAYHFGPSNSDLFEALFFDTNSRDFRFNFTTVFQWLNSTFNELDSKTEVIVRLENILYAELVDKEPCEVTPSSYLGYLGGCIVVYRFALERTASYSKQDFLDILDLLFKCLDSSNIESRLKQLGIHSLIKTWIIDSFISSARFREYSGCFESYDAASEDVEANPRRLPRDLQELIDYDIFCRTHPIKGYAAPSPVKTYGLKGQKRLKTLFSEL